MFYLQEAAQEMRTCYTIELFNLEIDALYGVDF